MYVIMCWGCHLDTFIGAQNLWGIELSLPLMHRWEVESQANPLYVSHGWDSGSQGSSNWPAHTKQQGQSVRGTLTHDVCVPLFWVGKGWHIGTDDAQSQCCPSTNDWVTIEARNSHWNITLIVFKGSTIIFTQCCILFKGGLLKPFSITTEFGEIHWLILKRLVQNILHYRFSKR